MSGIEFRVSIFFRPVFGGWPPPIVSMRKHADSSRALGNWVSSDSGADWRRCSVGLCVRLKLKRRRTWRLFVNKEPLNGLRHDADGVGDISIVWHAGYWRIVISMLRGWLSSNDISRKTFTSGDGLGENGTFVLRYWIFFTLIFQIIWIIFQISHNSLLLDKMSKLVQRLLLYLVFNGQFHCY